LTLEQLHEQIRLIYIHCSLSIYNQGEPHMIPNHLCRLRFSAWLKLFLISAGSLALVFLLLGAQAAQADDPAVPEAPGSISGIVTDSAGTPLVNLTVTLYTNVYHPHSWQPMRTLTTTAAGTYRFGLLSAGIYRVGFTSPGSHALQYYNNAVTVQEAQDVVVAGNQVTGINVILQPSARITGEITLQNASMITPTPASGGGPLPGYYGELRALRKVKGRWLPVKQMPLFGPPTAYTVDSLPAGVYRLCLTHLYYAVLPYSQPLTECYDNIGSGVDNATDITLTTGETKPNVNFVLGDGADLAQITGKVTAETGLPLSKVNVTAWVSQTYANSARWEYVSVTQTNAAGSYRLPDLQPGIYTVSFADYTGDYLSELYQDILWVPENAEFTTATALPLARFDVRTNVNATLTLASHLEGAVTLRDEGSSFSGASIQVYQARNGGWQPVRFVTTHPTNGTFRVNGLATGVYKVFASAQPITILIPAIMAATPWNQPCRLRLQPMKHAATSM
jgi:Carboxypeptidase regulatory-like domain